MVLCALLPYIKCDYIYNTLNNGFLEFVCRKV